MVKQILNGRVLELGADGALPPMPGQSATAAWIEMAALDVVFVVLEQDPAASSGGEASSASSVC